MLTTALMAIVMTLLPAMDMVVQMNPDSVIPHPIRHETELEPGDVLFRQSDPSDFVYQILEGSIDVVREYADGTEIVIATLRAGNYVGELGPMLGFPRSATVRASERTVLLPMTIDQFTERHQAAVPVR